MKRRICAVLFLAMLMAALWSASAEEKYCWALEQNGAHDYEQTDVGYANCTEDGFYVIECRQCGHYVRQTVMPATGHDWVVTHREEPGESSCGIVIQACNWCSESKSQKIYPEGTLKRGDKDSDGIKELQLMLIDCGYLNDKMDGAFGKNTEAAVKAFQKAAGLNADGIAWPQTMQALEDEWNRRQNYYPSDPNVAVSTPKADIVYAPFCYSWEDENGAMVTQQCERHALLWEATLNLLADPYADSALYSYSEWQAEVISLYNEWITLTEGEARERVENSKALCISLMNVQLSAMRETYVQTGVQIDPTDVYYGADLWMRTHCMWLCQMLSTLRAE